MPTVVVPPRAQMFERQNSTPAHTNRPISAQPSHASAGQSRVMIEMNSSAKTSGTHPNNNSRMNAAPIHWSRLSLRRCCHFRSNSSRLDFALRVVDPLLIVATGYIAHRIYLGDWDPPARYLTAVTKEGMGDGLFASWRYNADGSPKENFVLNQPDYKGAQVLIAGRNFGSGSSREHAPWALDDYGFRAILAPSFADIFYNNCFKNDMLPIRLDDAVIEDIFQRVAKHEGYKVTVDLEKQTITDDHGLSIPFEVDPFRRHCLLNGLDDIGMTLEFEPQIAAFEAARR